MILVAKWGWDTLDQPWRLCYDRLLAEQELRTRQ